MIRRGVIEKFIVRVNPAAFGYKIDLVLISTNNGITKDEIILSIKQFGDLAYHVHHMGKTSVAALLINKTLDDKIIQSLNDRLKPATVSSITVSELSVSTDLSETNLRIIKCLLQSGARTEISEIAKELDLYEKTITRRLNRMKEDHLLELYLQCNPAAIIGYIQFAIPIIVLKSHYRSVNERMFLEYQENILYSPSIIDSNNWLIFVLFGENLFKVDSALAKVEFFEVVKSVDVYILIKWQYYDDWILREIEERL
jgi:DNA-binding Lrp family transcriptional regulator